VRRLLVAFVAIVSFSSLLPGCAAAAGGPFAPLIGWWIGDGRLGFKDGKSESVKCRVTYIAGESADDLAQSIRCASASGKVEIKSNVRHAGGKVTGTWSELVYNLNGQISGEITNRGYRVSVTGDSLNATMDIIVKDRMQIIEIHFDSSTLFGLTLVLKKG
jgi:hypothetical protein